MASDKQEKLINSYTTKEEFIAILEKIDFVAVKRVEIEMIKVFLLKEDEKIEPLTLDFRIDDY